nr:PREDICTED: caspase recruitment domain-containing protein 10-like [Latimeria chalumnae]|eukprot:XP_014352925.1 PREDICTED: caspase recruitment domain-containing protein 10-like [Latimeria chalumnae]
MFLFFLERINCLFFFFCLSVCLFATQFQQRELAPVRIVAAIQRTKNRMSHSLIFNQQPYGDDNILPYCLVQPVTTPNQRPVILTPGRLAKALIQKILQLPSSDGSCFEDCPTEILEKKGVASSEMLVVRNVDCSRVECIQFKTIKASITQNKHGFLQLGLHSVKELVQREIYPIVIHIKLTEKSLKKLR